MLPIDKRRVIGGVTYTSNHSYDAADRLTGMTYPTGRSVTYERNMIGQVSKVTTTVAGVTSTVADSISHLPFGGIQSYTLGNGVTVTRSHLGTPQKLTDQSQAVAWDAAYEPFGEVTLNTTPIENPLRFPGQYYDAETGLHQNHHRDYDPGTGRYLQSDPIGLNGGINGYLYVNANPLSYSDPLGLWATDAHDYLMEQLANSQGLNQGALRNMQLGSVFADSLIAGHQTDEFSYLHSMTSAAWPDKTEACKARFKYIQEMLTAYQSLHAAGRNDAYWYLGRALHPLMDSTSPAHAGWQYWDNSQIPRHGPSSFGGFNRPSTEESLEDLLARPDLISKTMSLMTDAMSGRIPQCGCE